ncbi:hypothetical protein D915_002617 [Fasciola hepatica]|uniref:Integrin alpha third immunoglobulin-like domain-containing protein n=1 Tax=Fasciola hepatica TaxID=6192 RepID=A0A4E0REZ2_FASHE|nr:hypothetical protein D915_002617 [Fasciola hepatica]
MICCVALVLVISLSPLAASGELLKTKSYSDIALQEEIERGNKWSPDTPADLRPDYRPMELCDHTAFADLSRKLVDLVQENHVLENFEWTTVSVTTLKSYQRSYILIGGSSRQVSSPSQNISVSPRDGGAVYLCELEVKKSVQNPLGFGPSQASCVELSKKQNQRRDHEYLGAASSALGLSGDTSLLAYCDPLWRATTQVPVGRCFLQVLRDGKPRESLELNEFCQSGMQVGTPCMAGHSVALSLGSEQLNTTKLARVLSDVRLWVGEPLSLPTGRVQLVSDPYGTARVTTIHRPDITGSINVGSHFGYAVANGYASAPGFPHEINEDLQDMPQVVGFQTADTGTNSRESFGSVDWLGGIELDQIFSGFGTSILTIPINGSLQTGVVVGAPYADSEVYGETLTARKQANRGRIYLFCHTDARFRKPMKLLQYQIYDDVLEGPAGSTFFGFSLSRLGDLEQNGTEYIAVGAPDLDKRTGQSFVYLIRVLAECRFDPVPYHILTGPKNAHDFGARLPSIADDMDYNGLPDLAIPVSNMFDGKPAVQLFASRPRVEAECLFMFPPWLAIRRIFAGDTIPIQITVFLRSLQKESSAFDPIEQILQDEEDARLVHQVIADRKTKSSAHERFKLFGDIISQYDKAQKKLLIEFDLIAEHDVQDMVDIETDEHGLYVAYRFLQPCFGQDRVIDENGTCAQSGWLKRPFITWSKCIAHVPLSRYVCYPRPSCESDVSLQITDLRSNISVSRYNDTLILLDDETDETHEERILATSVNLTLGDQHFSKPELVIGVYNYGPTFAAGLRFEFQFHGNLRFYRLEAFESHTIVPVHVSENETWADYFIGTMPSPTLTEEIDAIEEEVPSVKQWKLSTYYLNFASLDETNFTLGAGVTVRIFSGTPDPQPLGNAIRFEYRVMNAPKIRISYGPKSISSRMDNRTRPIPGTVGHARRVDVSELGPRVEHVIQVEYTGPTQRLRNVTLQLAVPFQLAPDDQIGATENYLVYMFREIRATMEGAGALQWVDLWPKITSSEDSRMLSNTLGTCSVMDSETKVNPLRMIGMDVNKVYSRTRRHAVPASLDAPRQPNNMTEFTPEQLEIMSAGFDAQSGFAHKPSLFRRIPKEILQCDRVGYRLNKPLCTQIICHLNELPKNRPILVTVTGWLWAKTLFEKHISDVDVVTSLTVDQGYVPEGVVPASEPVGYFHLAQTFFFPQIRPKLLHQIPIWPIIVGVVLGIIFLALIVILLYALGFFKRKKPALRQASYSRGGADELERRAEEIQDKPKKYAGFEEKTSTEEKYERGTKRKMKGKHRGELKILHPADLAATKSGDDNQHERLLDDGANQVDEVQEKQETAEQ